MTNSTATINGRLRQYRNGVIAGYHVKHIAAFYAAQLRLIEAAAAQALANH